MSSNIGANTRVSIPSTMRKTIQDIKEISGNHSDEDVYAMLKECSMDPNETAQRLLFLDTFHEVKRKRDKRKDNVNGRMFESSTQKTGNQGRWERSGRGRFSSQYKSRDAGVERVAAVGKEDGLEDKRERGLQPFCFPVLKEVEAKPFPQISKTSFAPVNCSTCMPSDGLNDGHVVQNSETVNTALPNHVKDAGLIKLQTTPPQAKVNTEHAPSADTNLLPMQSRDYQIPTTVGARKSRDIAANMKDSVIVERDLSNSLESADETQTNQHGTGKVDTSKFCSSRSENSEHISPLQSKMNGESLCTGKFSFSPVPDTVQSSLLHAGPNKEEVSTKIGKLKFAEVQHVILPDHIQVPDAVKNVLCFGSLDARFGFGVTDINSSVSISNLNQASSELLEDGCAEEPESCDEGIPTTQEENYPDPPQEDIPETIAPPESNFSAPKDDQVKQETVTAVGPPYPIVQPTPTYGFGIMPPMLGSPLVQFEGLDHHARLLNTVMGNSLAMSTSTPTPPPAQSPGAVQSSVAASVQSLPLVRQPYPPNLIPYVHYFPPFFMPPTLQFHGHGSFPPQFPTGNMYLPSPAAVAASGMKVSPPYKPGTNVMSQAPVGMPSGAFGVYGSPHVGYNPSAVVTSGSSNPNEDLVPAAVLKENNVYLGPQSEGTTVWLGRDSTSLPVNPLFSLPPQSQHVTISPHSAPGAFAAAYHPLAASPLVQNPESMAGPPEPVGPLLPPPNSFHHTGTVASNVSFENHSTR